MKLILCTLTMTAAICAQAFGQTHFEFEAASIKGAAETAFSRFHSAGTMTGGPGTGDPGMFRCTCTVPSLITKAFDLQKYQFPGEASLPGGVYEVAAKVPVGTTPEQFSEMLQNLLKERFGLAWHFDKKEMQGYQLVVAKNGPKLKESSDSPAPAAAANHGEHGWGGGAADSGHAGMMAFGGQARFRADHQTMDDLARAVSSQILKPVDDQTGLKGKYDIALSWASDVQHDHPGGPVGGGHGDHGGAPGGDSAAGGGASGPTVFEALQSQLGLKLVPAKKSVARIFVVDHVEKQPTGN